MSDVLPFLVVGLSTGSVYALAAMGLVLTYKTSGVFNFAHGTQAALGAYIMFELYERHGWPWPVAVAASLVLAGVLGGLLLERMAQALQSETTATRVVATVGLLVGLQGLLAVRYGAAVIPVEHFLPTRVLHLPGVNVRVDQIIVTVLAAGAAAGLYLFFRRTRLGVGMQAVVDNTSLLGLMGTDPAGVRRRAWIVGSCFAAVSGILLSPTIGLEPTILTLLIVQAFGAAAIGGFSSLPLTYVGGLTIGIGQALSTRYLASHTFLAGLPSTLPFLVLFVALLVTPKRKLIERGIGAVRRERPPAGLPTGVVLAGGAVGVVAALLLPVVAETRLPTYTSALYFLMLFASLGLLVRLSGQVSLCHMAFAAVGAAAFAHAASVGVPWLLAVLVGGLMAVPVGAVVAIPAIRLSGVYLAIATFGFGILVERIFFATGLMFGAGQQIRAPRPGVEAFRSDTGYYLVVLAVAVSVCLAVVVVRRSRLGRLLQGLGDAPVVLDAHGTNTNVTRVFAFCISAFLAGIAGAVAGPITGTATGPAFSFQYSLVILAVLAIAGRRPVLSAAIASVLYVVVPGYVTSVNVSRYFPVLFGVAAIVAAVRPARPLMRQALNSRRAAERAGRSPVRSRRLPAPVAAGAVPNPGAAR